jgi:hypothetical protein
LLTVARIRFTTLNDSHPEGGTIYLAVASKLSSTFEVLFCRKYLKELQTMQSLNFVTLHTQWGQTSVTETMPFALPPAFPGLVSEPGPYMLTWPRIGNLPE